MVKSDHSVADTLESFKTCVILVEGKKDVASLQALGFERVFAIHVVRKSVRESVEAIVKMIGRGETVYVLMDIDEAGGKLYQETKQVLQELGFKVNDKLRKILISNKISHIEGLYRFIEREERTS